MIENKEAVMFVKDMYLKKFNTLDTFEKNYNIYKNIPDFKANENIHEIMTKTISPDVEELFVQDHFELPAEVHWIMRSFTQYYITEAFKAMKIDLDDPNTAVNALGKGTPGRIAKMWCGNDPDDITELGSGRWNKQPFVSIFPNTDNDHNIVTKQVDIVSCCSHHFLPFSTLYDTSKAVATISYIPNKFVLGISKLQRIVDWASRRFWLQEDLTRYIGKLIQQVAETDDVYVKLDNITHGCEKFRGANSRDGHLTTEYRSGYFKSIVNI